MSFDRQIDEQYMLEALSLAHKAFKQNEVPVGAVVVDKNGAIIGSGFNEVESKKSQCAHAELTAISQAAKAVGDWRLDDCTLYVTLEPCSMCFGLIRLSRLSGLIFAAPSLRFGYQLDNVATSSVYKKDMRIVSGVCGEQSEQLLKQFFQLQRVKKGEYKAGSEKNQKKPPRAT